MTETVTLEQTPVISEETKRVLSPEQIIAREIRTMPNKQMNNRLNRLARQKASMIDGLWAVALATVFENTEGCGRTGKLAPFLR